MLLSIIAYLNAAETDFFREILASHKEGPVSSFCDLSWPVRQLFLRDPTYNTTYNPQESNQITFSGFKMPPITGDRVVCGTLKWRDCEHRRGGLFFCPSRVPEYRAQEKTIALPAALRYRGRQHVLKSAKSLIALHKSVSGVDIPEELMNIIACYCGHHPKWYTRVTCHLAKAWEQYGRRKQKETEQVGRVLVVNSAFWSRALYRDEQCQRHQYAIEMAELSAQATPLDIPTFERWKQVRGLSINRNAINKEKIRQELDWMNLPDWLFDRWVQEISQGRELTIPDICDDHVRELLPKRRAAVIEGTKTPKKLLLHEGIFLFKPAIEANTPNIGR